MTEREYAVGGNTFAGSLVSPEDPLRDAAEGELPFVPLVHRRLWDSVAEAERRLVAVVRDIEGRFAGLAAVDARRSRVLPTHWVWRVQRLHTPTTDAAGAILRLLADAAREEPVLRVAIESFGLSAEATDAFAGAADEAAYRRSAAPRRYRETILVPLDAPEDVLFSRLHATARRHVRAPAKQGLEVRNIESTCWAPRMETLLAATFSRTGGKSDGGPLARVVLLACERPDLVRVTGLFRPDRTDDQALLAFLIGYNHGDHVEYATAASDRPGDIHAPLGYVLAWDLMRWSKERGARWFDFGGITSGHHGDPVDARGGISDFKRYFSTNTVKVGDEWLLEPHPASAAVAALLHGAARLARRAGWPA